MQPEDESGMPESAAAGGDVHSSPSSAEPALKGMIRQVGEAAARGRADAQFHLAVLY